MKLPADTDQARLLAVIRQAGPDGIEGTPATLSKAAGLHSVERTRAALHGLIWHGYVTTEQRPDPVLTYRLSKQARGAR